MGVFVRCLLAAFLGSVTAAVAADPMTAASSRGGMLYENHCTACHESIVHIRANRRAKSVSDLRGWVRRWSGELKLNWSDEEIDDVTEFLERRFYKEFGDKPDRG